MAQRVPNYVLNASMDKLSDKMDGMINQQVEFSVTLARFEENLQESFRSLKRHGNAIKENNNEIEEIKASEKKWNGINGIIAAAFAAIAALVGLSK